ncbi:MAG: helix-turn-helix transcriptional regulator [Alphaproteobacteria bacterium]|nr:helix-turn-helix transcriptional regulator [Alphaproteobacteria bacterium]
MTEARVGEMLRQWRKKRRLSQQDLAEAAEVSTRHLSCVETGKARPSREMLLVLSSALDIPLRERNLLLMAGGHGAAYRETDLGAPEMAPVRAVLDVILANAEPNPTVVANGAYDLVQMNRAMLALSAWLGVTATNLIDAVFFDLAPFIVNFEEVAAATLNRLHRELLHSGDPALHAVYERVRHLAPTPEWDVPAVALPVRIRNQGVEVALFTTLTSLGTATDVTTAELRIETYYPMDDASRAVLDALLS